MLLHAQHLHLQQRRRHRSYCSSNLPLLRKGWALQIGEELLLLLVREARPLQHSGDEGQADQAWILAAVESDLLWQHRGGLCYGPLESRGAEACHTCADCVQRQLFRCQSLSAVAFHPLARVGACPLLGGAADWCVSAALEGASSPFPFAFVDFAASKTFREREFNSFIE
jgi:hypothetical protein